MKNAVFVIIIVGILFGLVNFHFILFDNSLKILKKDNMTFDNTFVDARGAKKIKVLLNPVLIRAGIKDLFK
ncbi:MAG: hypothetical protein JRJ39_01185 [Deltaproteobacteria bacterium]|nr:hypothetical protein [Deltaproteobacteria bacterium]MBW1847680.1 hypothetical protein [Deltaproteobacteria bacterium]